ncbi:hypothetical protein INR49_024091 [Caranx melampygus]|nr:hypothetical protein INR49_024091 [Caranx melampygus]
MASVSSTKATSSGTRSGGRTTSAGTGGMWRFYTEDSPGLKVCRPQSFIKGSTLKGQLNYSLLTGEEGAAEEMVGMAMLLLSNAPHHPFPPLSPSLTDESPSLFPKLINKISHSTKTLTLVGWPGASAGDESALHRFSLHATHLGEVYPLLRPTLDP